MLQNEKFRDWQAVSLEDKALFVEWSLQYLPGRLSGRRGRGYKLGEVVVGGRNGAIQPLSNST